MEAALHWVASGETAACGVTPAATRRPQRLVAALLALVVALVAIVAWFAGARQTPAAALPVVAFSVMPPEGARWRDGTLAVSPDAESLVFDAVDANGTAPLWLRRLDSKNVQVLPGTEGARLPFWAPDSRSVGFFADGRLKRVDFSRGSVDTMSDGAGRGQGGTWNEDGTIVFAPFEGRLILLRAVGSRPTPLTALDAGHDEMAHMWPHFLPDGRKSRAATQA